MSPTPQTPPTDRPLTAGDVPLLREGDALSHVDAGSEGHVRFLKVCEDIGWEGMLEVAFANGDGGLNDPQYFTFVSRPATSAASEGEGVAPKAWIWRDRVRLKIGLTLSLSEAEQRREMGCEIEPLWTRPAPSDDQLRIAVEALEKTRAWINREVAIGTVGATYRVTQIDQALAALASPPVSERERELEGALNLCSAALQRLHTDVEALMADSDGVAGLHHNGDVASWSDLQEGGQFSDWLGDPLWAARNAWRDARAVLTRTTGEV